MKQKLTLWIESDIIKEAKKKMIDINKSLSEFIEKLLREAIK
jgi:hypothetical protein